MLAAATACQSESARHKTSAGMEIWTLQHPQKQADDIVADVDGWPITMHDVAAIARQEGIPPEEALQIAIDAVLVLRHAETSRGPEFVSDALKTAAVHELIRRFEVQNQSENIPDNELQKIYDEIQKKDFSPPPYSSRKFHFSHGQWRASSQLIVKTSEKHDPETIAGVDSLLKLVRDHYQLLPEHSEETFRNQAWIVQNTYIPVSFEQLPPVSMNNEENFYRFNGEFDEKYLAELFALPAEGAISDVFGTKFGRHWIYLTRIIPERHLSFEEARPELRSMVSEGWKNQQLEEWLLRLRTEYRVQVLAGRSRP